jgi:tetratricopeptide (TPR) repeat protein
MDILNTIISIRTKQNITQKKLAELMFCSRTRVNQVENRVVPLNAAYIKAFKEALNAPMLPLTEEEEVQFKQRLYEWKDISTFNNLEKAKEMKPWLARCAELTLSDDLRILYNIFNAVFYRISKNNEKIKNILNRLEKQSVNFTDEQAHWYNRQIGINELLALNYKPAYDAFAKAEKQGVALNLNNESLYYNMGFCLTDMGYAFKAIEYLQKAKIKATENNNYKNDVYIRSFIAINYRNLGKPQESLEMLEGCLRDELNKTAVTVTIGLTYRHIALAYRDMGDYARALENIEASFKYIDENKSPYPDNLYHAASILIASKRVNEGIRHLDKGITMVKKDSIQHTMLSALKFSVELDNTDSLNCLENEIIPKLKHYSMNIALINCYEKLYAYYEKNKKSKAYHYCKLAYELIKKLIKGDVS